MGNSNSNSNATSDPQDKTVSGPLPRLKLENSVKNDIAIKSTAIETYRESCELLV